MEQIVVPHMSKAIGAEILFEGTKSSVNLEKMSSNKTSDPVPNMTDLRPDAVHMDGMWCNYVQPWAGVAYNSEFKSGGVASWEELWSDAAKGQLIIPSLQNTEGMWTLFMSAMLGSGKPFAEAQYEIDAAFAKAISHPTPCPAKQPARRSILPPLPKGFSPCRRAFVW